MTRTAAPGNDSDDDPLELLRSDGRLRLGLRSGTSIAGPIPLVTGRVPPPRTAAAAPRRAQPGRRLLQRCPPSPSADGPAAMPRLPEAMLRRLLEVDGEYAGIAHYGTLGQEPGAAEVGVSVADRYQGRGIGRLLVDALRPIALRAGLTTWSPLVDPTNRPPLRLLRSLDVELSLCDDLVEGRQHLPAPPDAPVERLGALTRQGPLAENRARTVASLDYHGPEYEEISAHRQPAVHEIRCPLLRGPR